MAKILPENVRNLSVQDLGIPLPGQVLAPGDVEPIVQDTVVDPDQDDDIPSLPETDPILQKVKAALALGFAGVILSGPPGTGKSWYAKRIARALAGASVRVKPLQFHTSYQYEDFMEGFAPTPSGSFKMEPKVFPLICEAAAASRQLHVLVIDEFSRCDVARVFGEAMTYLETDKRGEKFVLASGREMVVPPELVILATMNPWDKGVDELDVALERRFAQIDIPPSAERLQELLLEKGADPGFVDRVVNFFRLVQRQEDETLRLGHAYFLNCTDEEKARLQWEFRLQPFFKKACRLDTATLSRISRAWLRVTPEEPTADEPQAGASGSDLPGDSEGGEASTTTNPQA